MDSDIVICEEETVWEYVEDQFGKQESSWSEHLTHELSTYKISLYSNITPHLTSVSSTDLNISSQQPTGLVGCWQSDANIPHNIWRGNNYYSEWCSISWRQWKGFGRTSRVTPKEWQSPWVNKWGEYPTGSSEQESLDDNRDLMRLLGNCWSSYQYFAKMSFLIHLLGKLNGRRKLCLIAIVNHVETIT